jgi:bifunctional ADP-heptose synthase (sugar kinase/adenylyltransferase)
MKRYKVLVIGEKCNDVFIYGTSNRKSPEGKGPVFIPIETVTNFGMAANTAANIKSMGIDVKTFCGGGNIIKTRFVDRDTNELYIRIDENDKVDRINLHELPDITKFDAVVISDYCKGFLSEEDIKYISKKHHLVILDTKKQLGEWCKNVAFIKLNRFEAQNNHDIILENNWLEDKIITTLDGNGAAYKRNIIKTQKIKNADVSGAGDTFVAGFIARYLDSHDVEESIVWANHCAGEVVKQKGVSVFKK